MMAAHKYNDSRGGVGGGSGDGGSRVGVSRIGGDDPWGAGTNWTKESAAAQAQASKRRHSTFVGGTGSVNMPPGAPNTVAGYGGSYGGQPPSSHSVPSTPWGSPGKVRLSPPPAAIPPAPWAQVDPRSKC